MKKVRLKTTPQFYTGWKLILLGIKIWLSFARYIFQRKKYPLFSLKTSIKSLVKPQHDLELKKIVRFGDDCYFSILKAPRWQSKPFDRYVAHGGLNVKAAGTALRSYVDFVILAITRKCSYHCQHCYEHFNIAEQEQVPIWRWKEVIRDLQKIGVGTIVLSGGEPLLRYEGLLELLESGDKNLSDFHLHSSGHGMTPEKARELKQAGLTAVAIGLDDACPERHDTFRGYSGAFDEAVHAIQNLCEASIFVYLNTCLTKSLIRSDDLWNFFELAKSLHVGGIQLYEPKPCGKYLSANLDELFSENDRTKVTEFFKSANQNKKYKDYPKVTYVDYFENAAHLGCLMGGLSHFHIDSQGNVNPCVFVPISFGNILDEDFIVIFDKMRKSFSSPLYKGCPSLYLVDKIKAKHNQGIELPIPFEAMESEWRAMLE
jgi:MoaA/NifB/PqqE/SkfB family radical SAM enzyme